MMKISILNRVKLLCMTSLLACSAYTYANKMAQIVDDFSHPNNNSLGIKRQFLDDKVAGGNSQATIKVIDGKLHISGEIEPPRGQPGWASSVLLLNPEGLPQDVSKFSGIRLLIKLHSGNISISANSTDISNFDYHSAMLMVQADGKFHEIKIPFDSMKRTWSEQTKLNTTTINSLSIVAFGMQKTPFEYQLDEVGFY